MIGVSFEENMLIFKIKLHIKDPTHNGQKKVYASRGMHTSDT